MEYSFLGTTGVKVSKLAFGTMSFGGEADEETSRAMFNRCREAGINFFDCADVYAHGRSEEVLGRLMADCRDEVVIASKGYFPTGDDVNARGNSRYHLVRAVEASLRRMKTDRIDFYFLHRVDDETRQEETLRALDDLVRQGKILYVGASNFAAWQVMKGQGIAAREGLSPFVCIQPMYNLVKRQAEVELFPMAKSERIGVVTYGPLGGGLLAGKYGKGKRPASGRLVDNQMYATRYADASNYEVAGRFAELAWQGGYQPASLAVAWVAAHPAVTAPLIGARGMEQLEVLLKAETIEMTASRYAEIAALTTAPPPATDRNEETSEHNYGSR